MEISKYFTNILMRNKKILLTVNINLWKNYVHFITEKKSFMFLIIGLFWVMKNNNVVIPFRNNQFLIFSGYKMPYLNNIRKYALPNPSIIHEIIFIYFKICTLRLSTFRISHSRFSKRIVLHVLIFIFDFFNKRTKRNPIVKNQPIRLAIE